MTTAEIRFRCSSLGYIMTEPREDSPYDKWAKAVAKLGLWESEYALKNKETKTAIKKAQSIAALKKEIVELDANKNSLHLSETAKTHCVDVWVSANYNRREEITSKYLDKGNAREEDAITLVSRINKIFYKKNAERLTNDFITGEPDLYLGESIIKADETTDTKCSWSANTFFRSKFGKENSDYYWQGMGYMALTGAKKHNLSYCLINATAEAINDEKRRLQWKLGVLDTNNPTPEYLAKAQQLEINMIYDMAAFIKEFPHFNFDSNISEWHYDIPMQERIHTITFERDETEIQKIYDRVTDCRKWMETNLIPTEQKT